MNKTKNKRSKKNKHNATKKILEEYMKNVGGSGQKKEKMTPKQKKDRDRDRKKKQQKTQQSASDITPSLDPLSPSLNTTPSVNPLSPSLDTTPSLDPLSPVSSPRPPLPSSPPPYVKINQDKAAADAIAQQERLDAEQAAAADAIAQQERLDAEQAAAADAIAQQERLDAEQAAAAAAQQAAQQEQLLAQQAAAASSTVLPIVPENSQQKVPIEKIDETTAALPGPAASSDVLPGDILQNDETASATASATAAATAAEQAAAAAALAEQDAAAVALAEQDAVPPDAAAAALAEQNAAAASLSADNMNTATSSTLPDAAAVEQERLAAEQSAATAAAAAAAAEQERLASVLPADNMNIHVASSDAPLNATPPDVTLQNATPLKDNNIGTGTDDSAKQAAKVDSLIDKTQKVLDELIAIRNKQNNNNNETQSSLENENKTLETLNPTGGKKKLKRKKTHYKKYNSNMSLKRKHKTNKIAHNN